MLRATTPPFSATAERTEPDPIAGVFAQVAREQAARPDLISLAAGSPDDRLLPHEALRPLLDGALKAHGPKLLNYTDPQGFPPLRSALARFLNDQGVACRADSLLVTSGGMEAVSMAAQMVLNPGDTVLVETPAFPAALSILKVFGANIVHVDCDRHGILPDALAAAVEQHAAKLVVLMPDFQNPTGHRMPELRRQSVAQILRHTGVLAVEDGVYSLLRFAEPAVPPLHRFAPEQVVYSASLSKVMFPASRVGAMVAPSYILERSTSLKTAYNMQASGLLQAVSERFLESERAGDYAHLKVLRKVYSERCGQMRGALEDAFPASSGFGWTEPEGGMFLWLEAPVGVDFTAMFDEALADGVAYLPGGMFYSDGQRDRNACRLNFASVAPDRMREGVSRLAGVVRRRFGVG
jgi:2-aminoadipate transaminase